MEKSKVEHTQNTSENLRDLEKDLKILKARISRAMAILGIDSVEAIRISKSKRRSKRYANFHS
jgi:hypothetical protein